MSKSSGGSAPAASCASPALAPTAAAGVPQLITLWVNKKGSESGFAPVTVASDMLVGFFKKEVVKKLPSLQGKDLPSIHLHAADESPDGKYIIRVDALDSRMKLMDAGVKDGTSIVVKVDDAAAARGASIFQPQVNTWDAFVSLLKHAHIKPIKDAVVSHVLLRRGADLNMVLGSARPELAKDLYDEVASLPSATTVENLKIEGYKVYGLLPHCPSITLIYCGWDDRLLKSMSSSEYNRTIAFRDAAVAAGDVSYEGDDKLLRAVNNLAPFRLHVDAAKGKSFIIMPRYCGTLEPRMGIAPVDAERIWRDVSACLKALHARGFAHMDIKAANVCTTETGCEVIDHGSIAKFGECTASTEVCIPRDIPEDDRRARPEMDWWMFAVLLAEKACEEHGIKIGSGATLTPTMEELRNHLSLRCVLSGEAKAELLSKLV